MTRMIERWFPCAEVTDNSGNGWGSGNTESSLWVWFAKRPVVQSKAAALVSLLPWPDDPTEQSRLQALVRRSLTGYRVEYDQIERLLRATYGSTPTVLDPFSGRGMIPLEVGRLGAHGVGIDYSPFANLGGSLLADLIHRDWSDEPRLPFADPEGVLDTEPRIVRDARIFLAEVGLRYMQSMDAFYPKHAGQYPWGYLWASTLPCVNCSRRFPLVGELHLRLPQPKKGDPGQSFYLAADTSTGEVRAVVHEGPPQGTPTRILAGKHKYASEGRVAVCPFCGYVHAKSVHTRMSEEGLRQDKLLLAADIADDGTKVFRIPTEEEHFAPTAAKQALLSEPRFGMMSARPDEPIPGGNSWTIQSVNYGDRAYGDLMEDRQVLNFIRLARAINDTTTEALDSGISQGYARALAGIATAAMMRKMRRSTRGARLQITGGCRVGDLFVNQSAVSFSYDWFESGLSDGPGTWSSLATQTLTTIRNILTRGPARPAEIERGDATRLSFKDASFDAVVMDPPYDDMIDYSDSSDLFFVWAKRAMMTADPGFSVTAHPDGVQEKDSEIIVKRGGSQASDHRTQDNYNSLIAKAFAEARRVVKPDGVVTIVFGHGDPEVWHRLLLAIGSADLVMTGSWPAKTESGGAAGSANIVTTLTMACRPAPEGRIPGRAAAVEAEVKAEVKARLHGWDATGLATTDMLMASAGPAMEVVGHYSAVLNARGEEVDPARYLSVARRAVQEAQAITVDTSPLESFDPRTQFALWWIRLFGQAVAPKSEVRWQALASDLDHDDIRYLVPNTDKGAKLVTAAKFKQVISPTSPVIDVVFAMAKAYPQGLEAVAQVLAAAGRDDKDEQLWGAVKWLSAQAHLPDSDPDVIAWTQLVRNKTAVGSAVNAVESGIIASGRKADELMLDFGEDGKAGGSNG